MVPPAPLGISPHLPRQEQNLHSPLTAAPSPAALTAPWLCLVLPNFNTSGTFTLQQVAGTRHWCSHQRGWSRAGGTERTPEPPTAQREPHTAVRAWLHSEHDPPGQPCCFGDTKCHISWNFPRVHNTSAKRNIK